MPPPPPRFHIKCHTHGTRYESRSFYHDLCNRNPHFVGLHVDKRRHWQVSDQPGLDICLCSVLWQVDRPGWKLGGLERHLLTRVSWHFAFLTTDGKSAVNNAVASSQPITDLYSWIWIWSITYSSPTYFVAVYCAPRRVLLCFVYSAFNVDKVRQCHCYIIYIKILFSDNSFIPLAGAEFDDSLPFSGASSIPLCYVLVGYCWTASNNNHSKHIYYLYWRLKSYRVFSLVAGIPGLAVRVALGTTIGTWVRSASARRGLEQMAAPWRRRRDVRQAGCRLQCTVRCAE